MAPKPGGISKPTAKAAMTRRRMLLSSQPVSPDPPANSAMDLAPDEAPHDSATEAPAKPPPVDTADEREGATTNTTATSSAAAVTTTSSAAAAAAADPTITRPANAIPTPAPESASAYLKLAKAAASAELQARTAHIEAALAPFDEALKQKVDMKTAWVLFEVRQRAIDLVHGLALGTLQIPRSFKLQGDGALPAPLPPNRQSSAPARPRPTSTPPVSSLPAPEASTWASIAARAASAPPPESLPKKPASKPDHRLFVRLPPADPVRAEHPQFIASRVMPLLPPGTDIKSIQKTQSGIAIVPRTAEDGKALHKSAAAVASALGATSAEAADPWVKLLIPRVPYRLQKVTAAGLSSNTVSCSELSTEVARAFNAFPQAVQWGNVREGQAETDSRTALIAFRRSDLASIPSHITLFYTSLPVHLRRIAPRVTQCTRCWGFHRPEHCTRSARCKTCASRTHDFASHPTAAPSLCPAGVNCCCPPRCTNCLGAHPADHPSCPVRPVHNKRSGIISRLTKEQVAASRRGAAQQRAGENKCAQTPTTTTTPTTIFASTCTPTATASARLAATPEADIDRAARQRYEPTIVDESDPSHPNNAW